MLTTSAIEMDMTQDQFGDAFSVGDLLSHSLKFNISPRATSLWDQVTGPIEITEEIWTTNI